MSGNQNSVVSEYGIRLTVSLCRSFLCVQSKHTLLPNADYRLNGILVEGSSCLLGVFYVPVKSHFKYFVFKCEFPCLSGWRWGVVQQFKDRLKPI